MNIFDIIGPVMVGPSSSHTAGAAKIGFVCRCLMNEPIQDATINLYASFLSTGEGHGTTKALVAGLLGMRPDDMRIPHSFEIAEKEGMAFRFGEAKLKEGHPNSVEMILIGQSGRKMEIIGESIGGGRINIASVDGIHTDFSGDYPTLIVNNQDVAGRIAAVTQALSDNNFNVATMKLYRTNRGGDAVMIFECDQEIPEELIEKIESIPGIIKATYLSVV